MPITPGPGLRGFVIGYLVLLIVVLTAPVGSVHLSRGYLKQAPPRVARRVLVVDTLINLAMFAPLGWGLRALIGRRLNGAIAVVVVTVIGAGLSVSVETIQYFLPQRFSSILDVVFNTLGTAIGALVAQLRR